ncbi:MAG TPA: hypothetical protein VFO76_06710 [Candidatus Kapabacteria bacterium]|nr:hypothetical protein [Candidatus Kapabacteria bacterium]
MHIPFLLSLLFFFRPELIAPVPSSDLIEDLYPLQIGNSWSYDFIGANADPMGYMPNYLSEEVTDTSRYLGHKLFQISQGGIPRYKLYFDSTSVIRYVPDSIYSFKTQLLHWPLTIGETVVFLDTLYNGSYLHKIVFLLQDTKAPITTRAGLFECYHFQQQTYRGNGSHPDTTVIDLWYAKGIGLVRNRYSKVAYGKKIDQGGMDLITYKIM